MAWAWGVGRGLGVFFYFTKSKPSFSFSLRDRRLPIVILRGLFYHLSLARRAFATIGERERKKETNETETPELLLSFIIFLINPTQSPHPNPLYPCVVLVPDLGWGREKGKKESPHFACSFLFCFICFFLKENINTHRPRPSLSLPSPSQSCCSPFLLLPCPCLA